MELYRKMPQEVAGCPARDTEKRVLGSPGTVSLVHYYRQRQRGSGTRRRADPVGALRNIETSEVCQVSIPTIHFDATKFTVLINLSPSSDFQAT